MHPSLRQTKNRGDAAFASTDVLPDDDDPVPTCLSMRAFQCFTYAARGSVGKTMANPNQEVKLICCAELLSNLSILARANQPLFFMATMSLTSLPNFALNWHGIELGCLVQGSFLAF